MTAPDIELVPHDLCHTKIPLFSRILSAKLKPMIAPLPVEKVQESRLSTVDFTKLEFGKTPTDHLFQAKYYDGSWHDPAVQPFAPITLSPFALVFHYGQAVFEGMKAFYRADGKIGVFRPSKNWERLNRSLERMAMPTIDKSLFMDGLTTLLETDRAWVPKAPQHALYLRPVVFATEGRLGVKISDEFLFQIQASPVAAFYNKHLHLKVETEFVRAAEGGVGYAKCAGNYAAAFYPTKMAKAQGYDQVIWTDAREHRYIEESGTMNILFIIDDKLVTPPTSSSILAGITRESLLELAPVFGLTAEERPVSTAELEQRLKDGSLKEAFGAGTAATIAPIEIIHMHGVDYRIPVKENDIKFQMQQYLEDLRKGIIADEWGWNEIVL